MEVTTVELVYFLPVGAAALAPAIRLRRRPPSPGYTGLMPLDRLGAACFLIVLSLAAAGQYLRGTALIAWLEGPPAMAARTP
jgi:hypothetical protein